jgi:hypothetical protein
MVAHVKDTALAGFCYRIRAAGCKPNEGNGSGKWFHLSLSGAV